MEKINKQFIFILEEIKTINENIDRIEYKRKIAEIKLIEALKNI